MDEKYTLKDAFTRGRDLYWILESPYAINAKNGKPNQFVVKVLGNNSA
jgi:hypothetical protein